jgi:hypothetical protein
MEGGVSERPRKNNVSTFRNFPCTGCLSIDSVRREGLTSLAFHIPSVVCQRLANSRGSRLPKHWHRHRMSRKKKRAAQITRCAQQCRHLPCARGVFSGTHANEYAATLSRCEVESRRIRDQILEFPAGCRCTNLRTSKTGDLMRSRMEMG